MSASRIVKDNPKTHQHIAAGSKCHSMMLATCVWRARCSQSDRSQPRAKVCSHCGLFPMAIRQTVHSSVNASKRPSSASVQPIQIGGETRFSAWMMCWKHRFPVLIA